MIFTKTGRTINAEGSITHYVSDNMKYKIESRKRMSGVWFYTKYFLIVGDEETEYKSFTEAKEAAEKLDLMQKR